VVLLADLSPYKIGSILQRVGRLTIHPLCVFGSKSVPLGAIAAPLIDKCVVGAIFKLLNNKSINSIYLDEKTSVKLCAGGRMYLGYKPFSPWIKNFVSTGKTPKNSNLTNSVKVPAEYYLASPAVAEQVLIQIGKITPLPGYLVISPCEQLEDQNVDAKAIICYGTSEKVRNLAALVHFRGIDIFRRVSMPFGPACTVLISYPIGITENAPTDVAYVGPLDPTHNFFIQPDSLFISIPIDIASQMALDIEQSFMKKREDVAFPNRDEEKECHSEQQE
jgi:hypothetical protein